MTETEKLRHWPVAIIQDRYNGTYSGGHWLAISEADTPEAGYVSRVAMALDDGPHGGDGDAMLFWRDPPPWIAVGSTPTAALEALYDKPTLETSHD